MMDEEIAGKRRHRINRRGRRENKSLIEGGGGCDVGCGGGGGGVDGMCCLSEVRFESIEERGERFKS